MPARSSDRAEEPPRLRADARRNRAKVLEAAQAAFEAEGIGVPLDDIARRAGVGAGTVYRHFPTKEALFEAVVTHRLDQLVADARALVDAPDPGIAFFDLFTRIVQQAILNRALCEGLLAETGTAMRSRHGHKSELSSTVQELLRRAQKCGSVRSDIDGDDVFAAIIGAVSMERQSGGRPGRMTAIVRDGLRPG